MLLCAYWPVNCQVLVNSRELRAFSGRISRVSTLSLGSLHERFLSFQISHLQINLERDKYLVSYYCLIFKYLCDVTGWLLAPVGSHCAYVYSRAIELIYDYVTLCNLQLYPHAATVCSAII